MNRPSRIRLMPTSMLRVAIAVYSKLGLTETFPDDFAAMQNELLARELPSIADESGGYPTAAVPGVQ